MPRWFNILVQAVGTAGSAWTLFGGYVPPKVGGWVVTGLTAAQAVVGIIAHQYNPDGTPATNAYVPPPAKN